MNHQVRDEGTLWKCSCYKCKHAPYKREYPCTSCGKYILSEDGEGTVFVQDKWEPKEDKDIIK